MTSRRGLVALALIARARHTQWNTTTRLSCARDRAHATRSCPVPVTRPTFTLDMKHLVSSSVAYHLRSTHIQRSFRMANLQQPTLSLSTIAPVATVISAQFNTTSIGSDTHFKSPVLSTHDFSSIELLLFAVTMVDGLCACAHACVHAICFAFIGSSRRTRV